MVHYSYLGRCGCGYSYVRTSQFVSGAKHRHEHLFTCRSIFSNKKNLIPAWRVRNLGLQQLLKAKTEFIESALQIESLPLLHPPTPWAVRIGRLSSFLSVPYHYLKVAPFPRTNSSGPRKVGNSHLSRDQTQKKVKPLQKTTLHHNISNKKIQILYAHLKEDNQKRKREREGTIFYSCGAKPLTRIRTDQQRWSCLKDFHALSKAKVKSIETSAR